MRSLGRPYLQHGRRHMPAGSDPIPGLDGLRPVMLASGNLLGSGATLSYIDLPNWATSSEDVFTVEFGTGGLSSTHGIAIHEEGIYRIWANWNVNSGTVGDTIVGDLSFQSANVSYWDFANTQGSPIDEVVYDNSPNVNLIRSANVVYVGGPAGPSPVLLPAYVFATVLSQGGNSYNVGAELLIERIATTYTSNTVSHTPI